MSNDEFPMPYTFEDWFKDHQDDNDLKTKYTEYFKKAIDNFDITGQPPILYREWCCAQYGNMVIKEIV